VPSQNLGNIFGHKAKLTRPSGKSGWEWRKKAKRFQALKRENSLNHRHWSDGNHFFHDPCCPVSFLAAHNIMSRGAGRPNRLLCCPAEILNFVGQLILWYGVNYHCLGWFRLLCRGDRVDGSLCAALAKLFSEEIEHMILARFEAIEATAETSSKLSVFAVIPQIIPPFLSYTLLRWILTCVRQQLLALWQVEDWLLRG